MLLRRPQRLPPRHIGGSAQRSKSAAVEGIGRDAGDLDLDVDDAVSICVQLEVAPLAPFDARIRSRAEIEADIGVRTGKKGHAGIGVDAFQDDEIAAGHAGALEGAG